MDNRSRRISLQDHALADGGFPSAPLPAEVSGQVALETTIINQLLTSSFLLSDFYPSVIFPSSIRFAQNLSSSTSICVCICCSFSPDMI